MEANQPALDSKLEGIAIRIEKEMAKQNQFDLPLREFFRRHGSTLHSTTGHGIQRLISKLYESGVFDYNTVEQLDTMTVKSERCRRVYDIIAQKGALRGLLNALKESENGHVIVLMESWLPKQDLSPPSNFFSPVPHDLAPVSQASDVQLVLKRPTCANEKLATLDGPPQGASIDRNYVRKEYTVTSGNLRGLALIVNVENYPNIVDRRDGAAEDVKRLEGVLHACNIAYAVINDPILMPSFDPPCKGRPVLSDAITSFQRSFDDPNWKADCCFVFVMAHGIECSNDCIALSDGGVFPLWTELVARFSNNAHQSSSLKEIPKIFVLNFCRGDDAMAPKKDMADEPKPTTNAPVFRCSPDWTDMLICCATVEGYAAVRQHGTWYIQRLCEAMELYADTCDFVTILDIVSDAMKKAEVQVKNKLWKQMSTYYNVGFDKHFYLKNQQPSKQNRSTMSSGH